MTTKSTKEYGRVYTFNLLQKVVFFFFKLHGCRQEVARGQCVAGSVDLKRCEDGDMEAFKRRRSTELKNGRGPQKLQSILLQCQACVVNPNLDHSRMSNQVQGALWEPTPFLDYR